MTGRLCCCREAGTAEPHRRALPVLRSVPYQEAVCFPRRAPLSYHSLPCREAVRFSRRAPLSYHSLPCQEAVRFSRRDAHECGSLVPAPRQQESRPHVLRFYLYIICSKLLAENQNSAILIKNEYLTTCSEWKQWQKQRKT